ncbi:unnamed protein product [Nippostrongylus brasiliensis]|uniref:RBP1 protein n=1 Tax=Nippostrongylus brasiliensis TaxID=27835 RepID=A0A0N4YW09_NIPBR|nr:unnamed protein product [Nippostrongylus brasiliensis]VDL85214.1 unnamed protein product [Nippostrongylus brasiliensis]
MGLLSYRLLPASHLHEALFGSSVARGGYSDTYESSQLLHSCHEKSGHDDTDQSEDSKEEEEEEEERGGAKKVGSRINRSEHL